MLAHQAFPSALLAVAVSLLAAARGSQWPRGKQFWLSSLIGLGLFVAPAVLVFLARHWISDLTRVALFSLAPVFAVVLEPYLGRLYVAQSTTSLLASLVALAGTLLLFPVDLPQSVQAGLAFAAVVLATACVAGTNCWAVRFASELPRKSILPFAATAAASASVGLLAASAILERQQWQSIRPDLLSAAWLAAVEVPALWLLFWLMRHMEGEDAAQDTPEARAKALKEATDAAAKADLAVVVVGRYSKNEGEGFDVKTMDLPAGQDELIAAVEQANPRTVVVLNTGNPVTMTRWIDKTPTLLDMWFDGQEGGTALASILFGDASPSGKLPVSLPKKFSDSPAAANYPGKNLEVNYAEGIYVGYRYYDTRSVEPQFPFGFGLSYTTFEYSDLKVTPEKAAGDQPVQVSLKVRNTGKRAGAEVVQVYVHEFLVPATVRSSPAFSNLRALNRRSSRSSGGFQSKRLCDLLWPFAVGSLPGALSD